MNFIAHLQTGIHITKMKARKIGGEQKMNRIIEVDDSGKKISWRQVNLSDYKDPNEFKFTNNSADAYDLSKPKTPIGLYTLARVLYNKTEMANEGRFKVRLEFKGSKNLTFECNSREDFDYCITGFELIKKYRSEFAYEGASFREHLLAGSWDHDAHYEPLTFKYTRNGEEQICDIGCGNDVEDILLISSIYGCLWSFLLAFFGLLLKGVLDSDESSTILFEFLIIGIFFVAMVGLAVVTGGIEEATKARKDAAKWRRAAVVAETGGKAADDEDL